MRNVHNTLILLSVIYFVSFRFRITRFSLKESGTRACSLTLFYLMRLLYLDGFNFEGNEKSIININF